MATEAVINRRMAEAGASVQTLVSALAEKAGVTLEPSAFQVRDPKMRRVLETEKLASDLQLILGDEVKAEESGESTETKEKPLSKMTKAELIDYADINNVDGVFETMTKAEIIEQIEGA